MKPFIIFRKNEQQVKKWSGGQTTQLCIFPFESNYELRNFDIRISTAKVEVEHAVFTDLSGFQRTLMVLDGQLNISHPASLSNEIKLSQYDSYAFDGGLATESIGRARDFNVMTSSRYADQLECKQINEGERLIFPQNTEATFVAIYLLHGVLSLNKQEESLLEQDMIWFDCRFLQQLELSALSPSRFLVVELKNKDN
jgi:environmental stress-induced protein Ves